MEFFALLSSRIRDVGGNPRAISGTAGLLVVFTGSLLASMAIDAAIVMPVAVVAAFGAGLLLLPSKAQAIEREEEHRLVGKHLERQVRNARKLSILDHQTALLQRWYFELRVAEEAKRCRRYETRMAVVIIKVQDSNPPKRVWRQEDEMDFVQMFARTLRSVDLAARINEREYAVCLPQTTEEGAAIAATRLLKNSGSYHVTAFMALCPRDGTDYETLVRRARVFKPPPSSKVKKKPSAGLQLVNLLGSTPAGEVTVPEGGTVRATKAQLRRASKRAGVDIRIWEESGAIHFERAPESIRQEGAA